MGTCSSSCSPSKKWWTRQVTQRLILNTEIRNPDWAKAINSGLLVAVKTLHATEPDIIDDPVDGEGHTAIHIAVIKQDRDLLDYILNNGANVNALGGDQQNTALHEAVILGDLISIKTLFAFGIDDQITNLEGFRAEDLCNTTYIRRQFISTRGQRSKLTAEYRRRRSPNPTMLGGMLMQDTSAGDIRQYIKESSGYMDFVKRKRKEIERRDIMLTAFGKGVGHEIDEIAFTLHQMNQKEKIEVWERFFHDQSALQKLTDVSHLLTALTKKAHALRPGRKHHKPPQQWMKKLTIKLTTKVKERLPKVHGKWALTRDTFICGNHEDDPENHPDSLYSLLYEVHKESLRKERPSLTPEQIGEHHSLLPPRMQY